MGGNISLLGVLPLFLSPLLACFVRIWNECNTKGFKTLVMALFLVLQTV